jgi:hypothetical protein
MGPRSVSMTSKPFANGRNPVRRHVEGPGEPNKELFVGIPFEHLPGDALKDLVRPSMGA